MTLLKSLTVPALLVTTFATGYFVRAVKPAPLASVGATPTKPADRKVLYWVDPMHPAYTSDKPGIAPDCGMDLEPVYADDGSAPAGNASADMPPNAIRIAPERQQLIGVKFAIVESGGATRAIRAVGKVAADERRIGHVHTRVDGWIEKVFVNFTGDVVKQGQPMLTIYSPEMLASEQELLLAARARETMPSLFDASRRRLQLWDLSDDQIDEVLRTGEPIRAITVRAPMAGFVTERTAFANQKVTPDSDLYTITDLSRVWIIANVFEADVAAIHVGDVAHVSFAAAGTPAIAATVSYIQPQVDPTTRTLQVRLDAANPSMRMKPDMFVDVEFGMATAPHLTVPVDAVMDTGEHQTVFVDRGNGYLEPRAVTTGERFGERVTIVSGLAAGERVVAAGTFLIDSESRLKSAATSMGAPASNAGHEEHRRD